MKKVSTVAGIVFLLWFVCSPIVAFAIFIDFNDFLRTQHFTFWLILGNVYVVLGLAGLLGLKITGQKIFEGEDKKTTETQLIFWIVVAYCVLTLVWRLLHTS